MIDSRKTEAISFCQVAKQKWRSWLRRTFSSASTLGNEKIIKKNLLYND